MCATTCAEASWGIPMGISRCGASPQCGRGDGRRGSTRFRVGRGRRARGSAGRRVHHGLRRLPHSGDHRAGKETKDANRRSDRAHARARRGKEGSRASPTRSRDRGEAFYVGDSHASSRRCPRSLSSRLAGDGQDQVCQGAACRTILLQGGGRHHATLAWLFAPSSVFASSVTRQAPK